MNKTPMHFSTYPKQEVRLPGMKLQVAKNIYLCRP
jgi:hypothetical protein